MKLKSIFLLSGGVFLGALPGSAAQELPSFMSMDHLLDQAAEQLQNQDYSAALATLDRILDLQSDGLAIPVSFWFHHAKVAFQAGEFERSRDSANRYLSLTGQAGESYQESLQLLNAVEGSLQAMIADNVATVCTAFEEERVSDNMAALEHHTEAIWRIGPETEERAQVEDPLLSQLQGQVYISGESSCAWSEPDDTHMVIISYLGAIVGENGVADPDDPRFHGYSIGFGSSWEQAEMRATQVDARFATYYDGEGYDIVVRESWEAGTPAQTALSGRLQWENVAGTEAGEPPVENATKLCGLPGDASVAVTDHLTSRVRDRGQWEAWSGSYSGPANTEAQAWQQLFTGELSLPPQPYCIYPNVNVPNPLVVNIWELRVYLLSEADVNALNLHPYLEQRLRPGSVLNSWRDGALNEVAAEYRLVSGSR